MVPDSDQNPESGRFSPFILAIPVSISLAFILGTYALYVSRLYIPFPYRNEGLLFFFVATCAIAIAAGYFAGAVLQVRRSRNEHLDNTVAKLGVVGFFVAVLLFVPTVRIYTGQSISDIFQLITDPAAAYSAMVAAVTGTRDERLWFVLIKTALSPFVVIALPYFAFTFFHSRRNKWKFLILVALMLMTSIFRGTDKEVFDVFILAFGAYLVALGIRWHESPVRPRVFRKFALVAVGLALVFSIFSYRKTERIGELPYRCFAVTDICHPIAVETPVLPTSVGLTMLARYLTQGYYGLSVALDGEFSSGGGFGHSRPLQFLGSSLFDSRYDSVLSAQLDSLGWASRGVWSTGMVWIGNDLPLQLVPLILFLLSAFMARLWREAVLLNKPLSIVLFIYVFFTFIYLPANLQLAQSGDLYFGFLMWLAFYWTRWLLTVGRGESMVAPDNNPHFEKAFSGDGT